MQINTSYQPMSYQQNHIQAQYLKDSDMGDKIQINEEKIQQIEASLPPLGELPRQTYGLSILERMSDDEYRAFLRATAEMTESEKIFAAQSLYRLNQVYQGQFEKNKNPYQSQEDSFIRSFQNAYAQAMEQKI